MQEFSCVTDYRKPQEQCLLTYIVKTGVGMALGADGAILRQKVQGELRTWKRELRYHRLQLQCAGGCTNDFRSTPAIEILDSMRSRERILANLESIYRESYERAKQAADEGRMIDLDSAYMRDQLMLEILLDIRDLFSVAPAASGGSALEKLETIRRLTKFP
jgi:hypothetical protein